MATSSRPTMSFDERAWAFVVGAGMAIMIITAGIQAVEGGDPGGNLALFMALGIGAAVIGTFFWILEFRPWRKFDDLTTPAYTGHAHDAHAAPGEHSEPETHEPPPPPVIIDPTSVFSPEPPAHH